MVNTDVEFLKVFKLNVGFDVVGAIVGFGVGGFHVKQLLHLGFDHTVFDFLKEQFGSAQLVSFGKQVYAAQFVPLHFAHGEHPAQFL